MTDAPCLHWTDGDEPRSARWRSLADVSPPKRVLLADDTLSADTAYKLVCEGTALLWQGDFHQARQMLQALGRRVDRRQQRKPNKPGGQPTQPDSLTQAHHLHRKAQAERARLLGLLLLPFDADHSVPLRRAPDVRLACLQAHGEVGEPYVASLRELQGLIGAHEWRKQGVPVPALGDVIHPHHGVFSPVRGEYVDLVAQAPLPAALQASPGDHAEPVGRLAWDIGAGTGVLSAVLARRGVAGVLATELAPQAIACARDNLQRLGLADRVQVIEADLFPDVARFGRSALIVCNPPWLPGQPSSVVEQAVYDPDSRMLRGYLAGLAARLLPGGEGWLILSDIAERLGLRSREQLEGWIREGGLSVVGRLDTHPRHRKAQDASDPLHAARKAEVTSLWRLVATPESGGR